MQHAGAECAIRLTHVLRKPRIADACERGVRMVWGKGVTPAVSAWYSVGGQPTAVWYLNVNDESASQAYMSFNFGYMAPRLPVETLEQSAKALESIPSLARKIAEVRQNAWNKYPTIMLPDLVVSTDHIDGLFQAINVVVDDRQRALTDAPA
jgi:hypothetical protein